MSSEICSYAGISENFHQWLGTLVAGRCKLLLLRTIFKELFFGVASCSFYTILANSCLLYMDSLSFFGLVLQQFPPMRVVSFYGDLIQVKYFFLFSSRFFRVISPDNLSLYQATLLHSIDYLTHAVWRR